VATNMGNRHRRTRRLLAGTAAVALALLAGCNTGEDNPTIEDGGTLPSTTTTTAPVSPY
jgi:hypothetical protein